MHPRSREPQLEEVASAHGLLRPKYVEARRSSRVTFKALKQRMGILFLSNIPKNEWAPRFDAVSSSQNTPMYFFSLYAVTFVIKLKSLLSSILWAANGAQSFAQTGTTSKEWRGGDYWKHAIWPLLYSSTDAFVIDVGHCTKKIKKRRKKETKKKWFGMFFITHAICMPHTAKAMIYSVKLLIACKQEHGAD